MHKNIIKTALFTLIAILVITPLSVGAVKIFKTVKINKLNIVNSIYSKNGKVNIKDALKVTKNALFKKDVNIQGDLTVDGSFNAVNFRIVEDILALDTASLTGGDLLYNQADKKVYVWNETDFIDLTQQDTDTNTVYTAGNNVAISESNVISATDTNTTYTAGDNVAIANGVISATDTDTDTTYSAGTHLNLTDTTFDIKSDAEFNWTGQHNFSSYNPTVIGNTGSLIFNASTTDDTDYWFGISTDGEGDDDDIISIGTGTTPGSNSVITIDHGNPMVGVLVGINDTSPGANLEVDSSLRLTPTPFLFPCIESIEGSMYYSSEDNELCLCSNIGAGYHYYKVKNMTETCTELA